MDEYDGEIEMLDDAYEAAIARVSTKKVSLRSSTTARCWCNYTRHLASQRARLTQRLIAGAADPSGAVARQPGCAPRQTQPHAGPGNKKDLH